MKSFNIMTSSEGAPLSKRVCLRKEELEQLSKEEIIEKWFLQDQYINSLKQKPVEIENSELVSLRESEEKLKQQQLEATRKENILVMRLTTKEQEMQEYASQIQELKQNALPSLSQLRAAILDPAINAMFERMRKEVDSLKARLEETQNELSAWKFTPDSNTGKRLMSKCRLLYVENEELGKLISSGRTAKLEGDLALQKTFSQEMKKSQTELDDFLLELDEDVEGMQSTIYLLQQQLKEAKDQVVKLQASERQQNPTPFLSVISTGPSYAQNGHQQVLAKRTSDSMLPSQQPPVASPPTVLKPQQETPIVERTVLVIKNTYVNGGDQIRTPTHHHSDEPLQMDLNRQDEPLQNARLCAGSPERANTPPPIRTESVVDRVFTFPKPPSPQTTSLANGKSPPADSYVRTPPEVAHEELASDDNSVDVDLPTAPSPEPATPALPVAICHNDSPVLVIRNSEMQEEAVNLTVTTREMSPPMLSTTTPLTLSNSDKSLKRTRQSLEDSQDRSPRRFKTEPFEPPRSSVDIDADTEVQVAQTLACWAASANKSDKQQQQTTGLYIGNGDVVEDTSSVSEGDL